MCRITCLTGSLRIIFSTGYCKRNCNNYPGNKRCKKKKCSAFGARERKCNNIGKQAGKRDKHSCCRRKFIAAAGKKNPDKS